MIVWTCIRIFGTLIDIIFIFEATARTYRTVLSVVFFFCDDHYVDIFFVVYIVCCCGHQMIICAVVVGIL